MNVLSFSFFVLVCFLFCTNNAALEIVAGLYHNCVYEPGQTGMKCWGYNAWGQLGYEDTNDRGDDAGEMSSNLSIVDLGLNFTVNTTSLGGHHSCAVSQEHAVKCWGKGADYYQLGYATNNDLGDGAGEMGVDLAIVEFLAGFVPLKVAAGLYHSCVLSTDALFVCFGYNVNGQCGAGISDNPVIGPPSNIAVVDLGTNFTPIDIAAFYLHVCAISQQQSIKCFGWNLYGQLGYGDTADRGRTAQSMGDGLLVLSLGSNFISKAVATGGHHTCALSTLKTAKCFGSNDYGQCGQLTPGGTNDWIADEANEMDDNLPVIVFPGGFVPMQMALGYDHTCILSESAQVVCFGDNQYGQLGLGHNTSTTSPTLVDLGTDFIPRKLTAGRYHTCAVSTVDTVKCWGQNGFGQLGLGHASRIGDQANAMGDDLQIVEVCLGACTTAPTTADPTAAPTTTAPTTATPTTAEPTDAPTVAPTTAAATTATPTITAPTTAAPTTITTTAESQTTHVHNNSISNHTVTVTIRTDTLSSTQVLIAISNAHNLSSTLLTITTLSSDDESEDGFATVELLVAVASNVELDYDVIEATLREAMVDEYGEDVQVDIDVHGDDDEGDAQSPQPTVLSRKDWVSTIVGAFVACVCCVAAIGLVVFVRRQRNKNAVNAPPPQPAAAAVPPPPPPQQIANIPGVSALAMTRVVSQSASQVVPGAAAADDDDDDDDDERKQGEEDVELEVAGQEGARASLVTAIAGNDNDANNRTPGDTIGSTVGNDPNLGVYELNLMVDL